MVDDMPNTNNDAFSKTSKARFVVWAVFVDGVQWTYTTQNPRVYIKNWKDQWKYLTNVIETRGHFMTRAAFYDNKYPKDDPRHLLVEIYEGRVTYISDTFKKFGGKIDQSRIKSYVG